jgi:hypothetical protein
MASRAPIVTPASLVTDEVQSITVDATGGTFTIAFQKDQVTPAQVTAPIAFDATPAQVVAALEALSDVQAASIQVTGGPGDAGGTMPYVFTFVNELGGRHIILLVTDAALLTGGAGTAVVARTTPGQSLAGPIGSADNDPVLLFAKTSSDENRTLFILNASDTINALVSWDGGRVWWPLIMGKGNSIVIDHNVLRGDVYAKNKDAGQNFEEIYVMWN